MRAPARCFQEARAHAPRECSDRRSGDILPEPPTRNTRPHRRNPPRTSATYIASIPRRSDSAPILFGSFLQFSALLICCGNSLIRASSRKVPHEPHTHERPLLPHPLGRLRRTGRPPALRTRRLLQCPAPSEGYGRRRSAPQGEFALPVTTTPALPAVEAFADLDMPAQLLAALGHEGVTVPFPIQAATLPNSLAGRDVLGPWPHRLGQDPRLRPRAARPYGGPARRGPAAAGPGPRTHPRAGPAGHRRAHPVRPLREAAAGHRGRRHVDRPAGRRAARRCRGRRRDAGPAQGPHRARGLPPGPGRHHRPRRGRPDGRHGLHAPGHRAARPGAARGPADAVLGHAGPQRRPAGPPLPHRPGGPLRRPVRGRGHHDGAPRAPRARRGQARGPPPRSRPATAGCSCSWTPSTRWTG